MTHVLSGGGRVMLFTQAAKCNAPKLHVSLNLQKGIGHQECVLGSLAWWLVKAIQDPSVRFHVGGRVFCCLAPEGHPVQLSFLDPLRV